MKSSDWILYLTPKEKEVLMFFESYFVLHGRSPTIREVSRHLGNKSPYSAHCHVLSLESMGFIRRVHQSGQYVHYVPNIPGRDFFYDALIVYAS